MVKTEAYDTSRVKAEKPISVALIVIVNIGGGALLTLNTYW
jgi:hypothetical protein